MTVTSPEAWLRCENIVKRYGGVTALNGVNLEVRTGSVLGLIGPNGAGKSTLSKILAGAVKPTEGSIIVDGTSMSFANPAEAQTSGLIMMPQEIVVLPTSSVIDNVTLGDERTKHGLLSLSSCRRETEEALAIVGLDIDPTAQAGSLPAPHQRMLMMARAVHRKARLLILDEPTAGLAEHEAELVVAAVRRLQNNSLSIIFVSHHLSEVAELSDRVVCVRESKIAADLEKSQITKDALVDLMLDVSPEAEEKLVRSKARMTRASTPSVQLSDVNGARLENVSLEAYPGEVLGITGLLGSGVTELVRYLVGAEGVAQGKYVLFGETVKFKSPADAVKRGVGYLPGDRVRAAFAKLSIRQNVSLPALEKWFGRLGIIFKRVETERVSAALNRLSVQGSEERPISALSGGNQQRALVSRLLASDVSVLILDEPTVGVDIRARAELWEALRALAADRVVIVASGDPEELAALSDRVLCIRHGKVATILEGEAVTERGITAAIA